MSEEQLKAAVEPTEQVEDGVEEISEEDLAGVAGGGAPVYGGLVAAPAPAPTSMNTLL